jgi:hypothetical protein
MDSTMVTTPEKAEDTADRNIESLCCPTYQRHIRAVWNAGPTGSIELNLVPEKDELLSIADGWRTTAPL